MGIFRFYVVAFRPDGFSGRSGRVPIFRELDAEFLPFSPAWERLQKKSGSLGHVLRQREIRYDGSTWNALGPGENEARFLRAGRNGFSRRALDGR